MGKLEAEIKAELGEKEITPEEAFEGPVEGEILPKEAFEGPSKEEIVPKEAFEGPVEEEILPKEEFDEEIVPEEAFEPAEREILAFEEAAEDLMKLAEEEMTPKVSKKESENTEFEALAEKELKDLETEKEEE